MSQSPPWARGEGTTGFTAPIAPRGTAFPAELRVAAPPRANARKRAVSARLITILGIALIVALVCGAGLLTWKALAPQDVAAPLPASQFHRPADGIAVGPAGANPVRLAAADGTSTAKTMTTARMAPLTLFIPALGVYMPLEGDTHFVASRYKNFDTIEVPTDPTHGVWYAAGGALYGAAQGTTLIASHVSQASGWGALRFLYTLTGGEMFYTKDAKGRLQSWQVTQMLVESHTHFPQKFWSATGVRQLVVVTCGGTLSNGHYDKNVFAVATPIDPKPVLPKPAATTSTAGASNS